ncbi:MAG TPA: HAMP domain-containing protein, partial [Magnetovibrio sp.]
MKFGLGHKIAAFTSALIVLIGAGLFSVLVYQEQISIHQSRMNESMEYTMRMSSQVENALYDLDVRELRRVISTLVQSGGADLAWVLDTEGRLLTDGSEMPELRNQRPQEPFVDKLLATKSMTDHMDELHHWTGMPVALGDGTILGYVAVAFTQQQLNDSLNASLVNQLVVLIPALLFGAIAAYFLGHRIARPLEAVSKAAEQIGAGNWNVTIDIDSHDEVGDLARTINSMAQNLSQIAVSRDKLGGIVQEKTAELERHRDHLEELVDERTREIAANEERFRGFAESTSDWFWEMDDRLRISYLSERFETVTGRPADAVLGKTRRELA